MLRLQANPENRRPGSVILNTVKVQVQTRISDGKLVSKRWHELTCRWVTNRAKPPKAGTEYREYDLEEVKHLKPHNCP